MNTDPAHFLDILGNENRRKIISLLASRPCYVSEISGKLGIAPKAVIGHLGLLESAGIVESCADNDQRRKYFSITTSTRLEIAVSPHTYVVRMNEIPLSEGRFDDPDERNPAVRRSAGGAAGDPASACIDQPPVPASFSGLSAVHEILSRLLAIQKKQRELSHQQKNLHMEEEYWKTAFAKVVSGVSDDALDLDILVLLMKNDMSTASLCHLLGLPPADIVSRLKRFESAGMIGKYDREGEWFWKLSPAPPA